MFLEDVQHCRLLYELEVRVYDTASSSARAGSELVYNGMKKTHLKKYIVTKDNHGLKPSVAARKNGGS